MDIRLHYIEQGKGEPLVLLHGNGESHHYFERQMDTLAAHFRVLAVDTRGHGDSPRGSAPFTLSQFVDDLLAFLGARGIERAHLLGFSDGGNIALLFALRYPDRVGRLILNGANLTPRGMRTHVLLSILADYSTATLRARSDENAAQKKELLGLMANEPHISTQALKTLRMPVLVIAGRHDMIRESHTRDIANAIPGARLIILEGDHFIAAKNSAAFNAHVLYFLLKT